MYSPLNPIAALKTVFFVVLFLTSEFRYFLEEKWFSGGAAAR
jgi:hypothetical protein